MIWCAKFNGRTINAIGIFYPITTMAYGETEEAARLNLYERYDHIMFLKLEPRPITILKACKVGDYIYRVVNGKLIGHDDPDNSSWRVVEGDAFPGFVYCQNQATGITSQLNDGLECIIRQGE